MSRERDGAHNEARNSAAHSKAERRALLMRIAKAEYSWPEDDAPLDGADSSSLRGTQLVRSTGIRRVVEKLLVRNPAKRAKIIDLWEDPWMRGEGAPLVPQMLAHPKDAEQAEEASADSDVTPVSGRTFDVEVQEDANVPVDVDVDAEDEDDGLIVDEQDIGPGSVAHQEH